MLTESENPRQHHRHPPPGDLRRHLWAMLLHQAQLDSSCPLQVTMPLMLELEGEYMASATWNITPTRHGFSQIQRTAVAVGTGLVAVATLPLIGRLSPSDLITLGLLAVVLWIGSIGGTSPGGVAAVTAAAVYALLKVPDLLDGFGSESVAVRALAFALVGMGSGFVISRLRATFESLSAAGHFDIESGTFSPAYIHEMVHLLTEEHRRYGKSFALIEVPPVLSLDETAEIGPALRRLTRASDVVGRSWDGGFLILLPNTDRSATLMVAQRIRDEIEREPEIPIRTYSVPENLALIEQVGSSLRDQVDSAIASG